jgi:hypothetical protein
LRSRGHEPSASFISHTRSRWVRVTTTETLAQRGRGGHSRRSATKSNPTPVAACGEDTAKRSVMRPDLFHQTENIL